MVWKILLFQLDDFSGSSRSFSVGITNRNFMHYGTMIFGKSLEFSIDLCCVDPPKRIEKTMEKPPFKQSLSAPTEGLGICHRGIEGRWKDEKN